MLNTTKIGHMVLADTLPSIFLCQVPSQLNGNGRLSGAAQMESLVVGGTGAGEWWVMEAAAWRGASNFQNEQKNALVMLSGWVPCTKWSGDLNK